MGALKHPTVLTHYSQRLEKLIPLSFDNRVIITLKKLILYIAMLAGV